MGKALGLAFDYASPAEVMAEYAGLVPAYAGISFDRLERAGLQWPCPDEKHPGTRFLHGTTFTRGLGRFVIPDYTPPMEKPDAEYPYYLNTGRVFAHYHTGTMTRRSAFLNREIEDPYVEIHPDDAAALGVGPGERIRVSSRRGSIVTTARISDRVAKGSIFAPFHFTEARANMLTNPVLDPACKTPEYKVCAVKMEKEHEAQAR
jgi:predicted molibdopterin-dependent oxidoreductase YjgC